MESYHCFCLLLLVFFTNLPFLSRARAQTSGFSIELIHRSSPLSPFYDPSTASIELTKIGPLPSVKKRTIQSPVFRYEGGYLMKIFVGTPPVERFVLADTGSDLIWFQCTPCDQCYSQDTPYFNPKKSSTYKALSCQSKFCSDLPAAGGERSCTKTGNKCKYSYGYVDGSGTKGVVAVDTIALDTTDGKVAAFPNVAIGCGLNNTGVHFGSGLIGLGPGPLSLITQLGSYIDHKFSYCLSYDPNFPSKLKFGKDAIPSGKNVVSTPMLLNASDVFYYVNLEAISIDKKRLANKVIPGKGNTVIDSGYTVTQLEASLFDKVKAAVNEVIGVKAVDEPLGGQELCYPLKPLERVFDAKKEIKMVFHFTGADVAINLFDILALNSENVICLQLQPFQRISIFGNTAQKDLHVGFDLTQKKVSFAPKNCAKIN